jgi:mRNA interferase RelE/StbE
MDSYKIEFSRSAEKDLRRLDKPLVPKIFALIESLSVDPRPSGVKKLSGTDHSYRIRKGDYRILYSVDDRILLIGIERIGHRKDIYK